MKLKKTSVIILAGAFVMMLIIALALGLSIYSSTKFSRVSLLTSYFRALATDDQERLSELTSADFVSDLILPSLKPGSYELYDFGETEGAGVKIQRFLVIVDSGQDGKSAVLADMQYTRKSFSTDIRAIRVVDQGTSVRP